jgi:hypothetical protein
MFKQGLYHGIGSLRIKTNSNGGGKVEYFGEFKFGLKSGSGILKDGKGHIY